MRSPRCPGRFLSIFSTLAAVAMAGCGGGGGGTGQGNPTPTPQRIVALLSAPGGAALNDRGSSALAINSSGSATGSFQNGSGQHRAFRYANGGVSDIGTLGGASAFGLGINGGGAIVGNSENAAGTSQAFMFTNGVMTPLSTPAGMGSRAEAINDNGLVVGATIDTDVFDAVTWQGGARSTLAKPAGFARAAATAVNNSGQVAGEVHQTGSADFQAVRWVGGVPTLLGFLPGGTSSFARSINESGNVVGFARTGTGATHAFLWTQAAGMTDLGTLGGATSAAFDINSNGVVVGTADNAAGSRRAFIYSNGVMTDLNALLSPGDGWTLEFATSINDQNQVVGWGQNGGQRRAFLLNTQ